jgi:DNA polymerase I-like protein with 3'-5' exonuclease and polymerase domains/uracil-DNA glycosylase
MSTIPLPFFTDPRINSAKCDICALGPNSPLADAPKRGAKFHKQKNWDREPDPTGWRPISDELKPGTNVLCIGSHAGPEERKAGYPFAGMAGVELTNALQEHGIHRMQVSISNSILCSYPGDEPKMLTQRLTAWNKRVRELAEDTGQAARIGHEDPTLRLFLDPVDACLPRLLNVARKFPYLMVLGTPPLRTFSGNDKASIMTMRGSPFTSVEFGIGGGIKVEDEKSPELGVAHRWKVMPTFNPAYVRRFRRWRRHFRQDIERGKRFWSGNLNWRDPQVIRRPTPAQLKAYLRSGINFAVVDIETLPGSDDSLLAYGRYGEEAQQLMRDIAEAENANESRKDREAKRLAEANLTPMEKRKKAALDPLRAVIDRVGIGDSSIAFVVEFISVETGERVYPQHVENEMWQVIQDDLLLNPQICKGVWNSPYDSPALALFLARRAGLPDHELDRFKMNPRNDGILTHKSIDSEFPHNLAFAASSYTDVGAWKEAHKANQKRGIETDASRSTYCGFDVSAEASVIQIITPIAADRQLLPVIATDHLQQEVAMNLHEIGIKVDQRVRQELEDYFKSESRRWLTETSRLAGRECVLNPDSSVKSGFNANSNDQVARVLYDEKGFTVYEYTDSGKPSTSDDCLISLFVDPFVAKDPTGRDFIRGVRKTRKSSKKRGTFVMPLRPQSQGGFCWPDGRLRTTWGVNQIPSGRMNSGDPLNLQNVPVVLRTQYVAEQNCQECKKAGRTGRHVYVAADADQLELRVATGITQCAFYLHCFKMGWDPHGILAEMTWGDRYRNADGYIDPKKGKPASKSSCDRMRDLAKIILYLSLYAATVETAHNNIVTAENAAEELVYADFSMTQTTALRKAWMALAPEFELWWKWTEKFWEDNHYVEDPISHRRRDCLDSDSRDGDVEVNLMVNHPVQSAGRTVVIDAMLEMVGKRGHTKSGKSYPKGFACSTSGMILDVHDALYFESPEEFAVELQSDLTSAFNRTYPELPNVEFKGKAKITTRWTGLGCKACGGDRDHAMKRWSKPEAKFCDCRAPEDGEFGTVYY